jgi:hypothetical protein
VIADFEQTSCIEKGQGTVVSFAKYDALERMRKAATKWMDQEHPLVAEQNRYYNVGSCGIGWHGDAERDIVWGVRIGDATQSMPLMFQAYHRNAPIGPKTIIRLAPGDVYVMSNIAVGKDWHFSSRITWRHAAGAPSCSCSKDPKLKRTKQENELTCRPKSRKV